MSGSTLSDRPRWVAESAWNLPSTAATAAGDYVIAPVGAGGLAGFTATRAQHLVQRADFDIYERDQYHFMELQALAGDTAPATTYYYTLYPVASWTGTAAAPVAVLGTEVPGARSATVATPAANATTPLLQTPHFLLPADGLYIAIIHTFGAFAANSFMWGGFRWGVVAV